jgi:hypothetical protein
MATTLERNAWIHGKSSHTNLKFVALGTIAVGNNLTLTTPKGQIVLATVEDLRPYGSAKVKITQVPTSGILVLPKNTAVA